MTFKRGHPKLPNSGRKRGVKNKVQHNPREQIIAVFEYLQKNPQTSLKGIAKGDPDAFYNGLYKAIVPRETKADVTHDLSENLMNLAVQVAQDLKLNGGNGNGNK